MTIRKILIWPLLLALIVSLESRADEPRLFTAADDIELTQFGDLYTLGGTEPITVSPDKTMVVVHTERGALADNRLHDELRFYDMEDVRHYVNDPTQQMSPEPKWSIQESTNKDGANSPLIKHIRWLANSRGIGFVLRTEGGRDQLFFADLDRRTVQPLSPEGQDVTDAFEIHDQTHYVFTVRSGDPLNETELKKISPEQIITGKDFWNIVFPEDTWRFADRSIIWAANGGVAAPVNDRQTGKSIVLYAAGQMQLKLSPDGRSLVTLLPVEDVPKNWESRYPPPYPEYGYRVRAGRQDLNAAFGSYYVSEYVRIRLDDGTVMPFKGAVSAIHTGWLAAGRATPEWSSDGQEVLLAGTYTDLQPGGGDRPCIAVANIRTDTIECVVSLRRQLATGFESGYENVNGLEFVPGRDDQVNLKYQRLPDDHQGVQTFARVSPGVWQMTRDENDVEAENESMKISVDMSFDRPPTLVATDRMSNRSKILFDPNPQLKSMALGGASIYKWKDKTGRKWSAILFMPSGYQSGRRYPLVIQNHGYNIQRYSASGGFPSVFAAQELASAGIVVLQMRDCEGRMSPQEGSCNVLGYESGVEQLAKAGVVDVRKVGIVGFSRTVFYVMKALTSGALHFEASEIADGINLGYFQHLTGVDISSHERMDLSMIGAHPVGAGLRKWLRNSPEFNMDKVNAPLRIVGMGNESILSMWEPYALLREMHKPVELVELDSEEHILTNPAVRLASQGGTVDWFRFWLQGYEESDPAKTEQYQRWETLCDMQVAGNPGRPSWCVGTQHQLSSLPISGVGR